MSTTVTKRTSYYGPNSIMGSQGTPSSIIFGGGTGGGTTPIVGNYIGLGAPSNPIYSIPVFSTATDAMGDASFVFDLINLRLGLGISEPLNLFHMYSAGDGDALRLQNCWIGFQALGASMYDLVLGRWEDYFLDLANWGTGAQRDATCFRITGNLVGYEATLVLATQNTGYEFVDITNNNYPGDKFFRYRMQAGNSGSQWKTFIMDYRDYTNGNVIEAFRVLGNSVWGQGGMGDVLFSKSIGSTDFVSGFAGSGWKNEQIAGNFTLTVDNLVVRKALNVYELVVNKIRATNGSLWVSDSMKASLVLGPDYTTVWEGLPIYHVSIDTGIDIYCPFAVDDLVRCQKWDGRNIKYYTARVMATHTSLEWIMLHVIDGTDVPEEGDDIVRIGNLTDTNRQGALYLTASDSGAPYMDILDGVNSASFAGKTKVRLGKLSGITDAIYGTLSGYGLYSNNVYLTGAINAVSGYIGGFTIHATDGLYAGTAGTRVQMKVGAGFWTGATAIEDAPFSVTNAGVIKATSGTIGGWNLGTTTIFSAATGGRIVLDKANNHITVYRDTYSYLRMGYTNDYGGYIQSVVGTETLPDYDFYFRPGTLQVGAYDGINVTNLFYVNMVPGAGSTQVIMKGIWNQSSATEGTPNWKALYVDVNTGNVARAN